MERARQALNDARHVKDTYGALAAELLRQSVSEVPKSVLTRLRIVCWDQISGAGRETMLGSCLTTFFSSGTVYCDSNDFQMYIDGNSILLKITIRDGLPYKSTPLAARVVELWLASQQSDNQEQSLQNASPALLESSPTVPLVPRKRKSSITLAARDAIKKTLGFQYPDLSLGFSTTDNAGFNILNGTVELKSYPERSELATMSSETDTASEQEQEADPLNDAAAAGLEGLLSFAAEQQHKDVDQLRMQSVRDHFRVGLSQAIAYLLLSLQMKSGWLGLFYLGTKYTRLAAISPDAIAIEFDKPNPSFWDEPSWLSNSARTASVTSQLGKKAPPIPTTEPSPSGPAVVKIEELFQLPNRYHERLGHEMVDNSKGLTGHKTLHFREESLQTLLDFFVAAAFDRLHLPNAFANVATDWTKVKDKALHHQLLAMLAHVDIDSSMYDAVAWRAGPDKITKTLVNKVKTQRATSPPLTTLVTPEQAPDPTMNSFFMAGDVESLDQLNEKDGGLLTPDSLLDLTSIPHQLSENSFEHSPREGSTGGLPSLSKAGRMPSTVFPGGADRERSDVDGPRNNTREDEPNRLAVTASCDDQGNYDTGSALGNGRQMDGNDSDGVDSNRGRGRNERVERSASDLDSNRDSSDPDNGDQGGAGCKVPGGNRDRRDSDDDDTSDSWGRGHLDPTRNYPDVTYRDQGSTGDTANHSDGDRDNGNRGSCNGNQGDSNTVGDDGGRACDNWSESGSSCQGDRESDCDSEESYQRQGRGFMYDLDDYKIQRELSCKIRIQAIKDLGIRFIAVSTADMDRLIAEHIEAVDEAREGAETSPTTSGAGGPPVSAHAWRHLTRNEPSTPPRRPCPPRKSHESSSSLESNHSGTQTIKTESSVQLSPLGLRNRPSTFYTDTSISSAGSSFMSRMRSMSITRKKSSDDKNLIPAPIIGLAVPEQLEGDFGAAMETDK